jgi:hypothetical protein
MVMITTMRWRQAMVGLLLAGAVAACGTTVSAVPDPQAPGLEPVEEGSAEVERSREPQVTGTGPGLASTDTGAEVEASPTEQLQCRPAALLRPC